MRKNANFRILLFFVLLAGIPVTSCTEDEQIEPQISEVFDLSEALEAGKSIARADFKDDWGYAYALGESAFEKYREQNPELDGVQFSDVEMVELVKEEFVNNDHPSTNAKGQKTTNYDPFGGGSSNLTLGPFHEVFNYLTYRNRYEVARVLDRMRQDMLAAAKPYYDLGETNSAYYNSTNTTKLENSLRTVLNKYATYTDSKLSSIEIAGIRKSAVNVRTNLSVLVKIAKDELAKQQSSPVARLWWPKKKFGKIVQAIVNLVVVVAVTTTLGTLGVTVESTPNKVSGSKDLVGPIGGFLAGISWWAYMVWGDQEQYWI